MKYQCGRAGFDRLAHRRAVRKLDRIDAGAVQHKREKMADAGFFIHHIAEGRAIRGKRRRFDGGVSAVGCGRRWSRRLGHAVLAHSNRGKWKVPQSLFVCQTC